MSSSPSSSPEIPKTLVLGYLSGAAHPTRTRRIARLTFFVHAILYAVLASWFVASLTLKYIEYRRLPRYLVTFYPGPTSFPYALSSGPSGRGVFMGPFIRTPIPPKPFLRYALGQYELGWALLAAITSGLAWLGFGRIRRGGALVYWPGILVLAPTLAALAYASAETACVFIFFGFPQGTVGNVRHVPVSAPMAWLAVPLFFLFLFLMLAAVDLLSCIRWSARFPWDELPAAPFRLTVAK